jgi:hypothetical protein
LKNKRSSTSSQKGYRACLQIVDRKTLITLFWTGFWIGFRHITLWLACILGYVYRFMVSGWLRALYWLAIVAAGIWFAEWLAIRFNLFNVKSGTWFQVGYILAIYTLVALLRYGLKARKQVVVEEFIDYTCNSNNQSIAKGLATLLVIKLTQLRELYQAVDEQRAIPTNIGMDLSLDPTINVEDVSGFLKGAVTPDSKLSGASIGYGG